MPSTKRLKDYQRHGVRWLVQRFALGERAAILCDDPGLGKTLQALVTIDQMNFNRVLVTCPAGARNVWLREIGEHFPAWLHRVVVLEPGLDPTDRRLRIERIRNTFNAIVVVSYDLLSDVDIGSTDSAKKAIFALRWDLLILDEVHYLKGPSRRTYTVYGLKGGNTGLQSKARFVLLMSGTLIPNHSGELYQHVRTFFPSVLWVRGPEGVVRTMTEAEFVERYTRFRTTTWGRVIVGSQNQDGLRQAMGKHVLRRRKSVVLPELDPVICEDYPLDINKAHRSTFMDAATTALDQRLQAMLAQARHDNDQDVLAILQREDTHIATLRRQIGEMKVVPTVTWVQERMACGVTKMLIFGWHTSVLSHLHRLLAEFNPVMVIGDTPPSKRREAAYRFQNDDHCRVFVGQIIAAGTALTLTAANAVAILEPSWVPAQNSQAIDRAHRIGQHDSVLATFLYAPGTVDERVMRTFRRKAQEVAPILDFRPKTRTAAPQEIVEP